MHTYAAAGVETTTRPRCLTLPDSRGPLTQQLFAALTEVPDSPVKFDLRLRVADPLADDDLQLALYVCYELHYSAIDGVDERWEWAPSLLGFRAVLEGEFQRGLDGLALQSSAAEAGDVGGSLQRIVAEDDGPSLSRYVETQASEEQFFELVLHRSAYQLKEADPHSWAIPRLSGAPKAALMEVQSDEYGEGTLRGCTPCFSRTRWSRSASTRHTAALSASSPASRWRA